MPSNLELIWDQGSIIIPDENLICRLEVKGNLVTQYSYNFKAENFKTVVYELPND